jgi:ribosome maturation factor RimP
MAAIDRLESLLAPVVEDLGYEFVGIEYSTNPKNRVLRLYIDQAETGIGLEDCETVSREVSAVLDVEEPIPGQFTLEVSSPGVERPLFTAAHYQAYVGETAVVHLHAPLEGRRKFKGRIVAVENDEVCLDVDGTPCRLPLAGISKGRLAPDLDVLFAGK